MMTKKIHKQKSPSLSKLSNGTTGHMPHHNACDSFSVTPGEQIYRNYHNKRDVGLKPGLGVQLSGHD